MRIALTLAALVLATLVCAQEQKERCSELWEANTEDLLAFLQDQQTERLSPCLPQAISTLGKRREVRATHVLIGYLDYLDPATAPLPSGGAVVRPNYPAVSALFQIGKPARVELISAVQNGRLPKLFENAWKTYEYVYRDDLASGIRELQAAMALAESEGERRRLENACQKLAEACKSGGKAEAQACETASSR